MPWDDPTLIPVVLKLPKAVAHDPAQLKAWLADAVGEIERNFAP